ncbi:MAG: ACT domain-containing protein, partial [Eubacteriales bacterium]|nr:ACT domain-containing protein [Eubacteriales bacterium]
MQKALVSVAGQDRVGIIAKVSTTLFEQNINILEISQTILDGCFTMLMVVDIADA